jgi:hypothetical protein
LFLNAYPVRFTVFFNFHKKYLKVQFFSGGRSFRSDDIAFPHEGVVGKEPAVSLLFALPDEPYLLVAVGADHLRQPAMPPQAP